MKGKPSETPELADAHQNTSAGAMADDHLPISRRRIVGVYGFALLLSLMLFYFHVVVIVAVIAEMHDFKAWMLEHLGPQHTGKTFLLGSFLTLLLTHIAEAGVWGLFLWRTGLLSSTTDGIYFAAVSLTTLGYGDILLKYPWRHLGTLIAITGVLMFGCSTAFLFVVLQEVWQNFLPQ